MKHQGSKILTTERIVLRPFREEDAQAMFDNWASDERVTKFLTWPTHASVEVTRGLIRMWEEQCKSPEKYNWCLTDRETGEPFGSMAVVSMDGETPEVGYCIAQKCWGRGLTAEALQAVLAYLMDEVGAKRVIAKHDVENPNSGRVMEKAGMKPTDEAKTSKNNIGDHRPMKVWAIENIR